MMTIRKRDGSIDSAGLTYLEVLCNVILLGALGQLVIVFLPFEILSLSIGWWIGIAAAIFMTSHLYSSLNDIVMMNEADANQSLRTGLFIRYGVICVVMAALYLTKFVNPVSYVFGVIMLKPAAYLQPLTDKIYGFMKNRK